MCVDLFGNFTIILNVFGKLLKDVLVVSVNPVKPC